MRKKSEIETSLQVEPARRRRKAVAVTREEHEQIALESSYHALIEHGIEAEDPHFTDVQIYCMTKLLGMGRGRSAELCGVSKMRGSRVFEKIQKNEAFRNKCEGFISKIRAGYQDAVAARLPDIAELDSLTLKQYRDNPQLLVDKPSALKHLRQVANVQAPDGVTMQQNVQINLESLQALIQNDVST